MIEARRRAWARVKRRLARVALVSAVVAATAGTAATQSVPSRLTLEEAIRIAEENSPDYHRERSTLARSGIDRRLSFQTTFLPQVSSAISLTGQSFRRYTAENFDGVPLDEPYLREGESSSTAQTLGVNMTLFSGQSWMQHRALVAGVEGTRVRVGAQLDALRVALSRRYYAVVQADQAVALERRLLARAVEDQVATQKRFDLGLMDREAVTGAQLSLIRREHALERAIGNARKARLDLLEGMGIAEEPEFEPDASMPEPFDPTLLDVEEIVAFAASSSPRVRQAEAQLSSASATAGAAGAVRWPTVRAQGLIGRTRTSADYDSFLELNPPNWDYTVSLLVQIPVPFLRYSENANVARTKLDLGDARENLTRERNAVDKEVRRLVIDLRTAYGEIRVQERQAELLEERLSFLEERARVGQPIDYLQLETARDEAADAERSALGARIAFHNLVLSLEQLVGREVAP